MDDIADSFPVLNCWACNESGLTKDGRKCPKCDGTTKVFWIGRAFPYTPRGESQARSFAMDQLH